MSEDVADVVAVGKHYDERSPIEEELRDGRIHMWYWYGPDDAATLGQALHRMTVKVTDTLGLCSGEHLLDAGCGTGETAAYLAAQGVRVTGLTISGFEASAGRRRAVGKKVADRVHIDQGDYHHLPYADGTFDAVLALESLQNASDVSAVLAEFYRVLRPGGRLTLADLCLGLPGEQDRLDKFMAALRLTRLPSLSEWAQLVEAAGFVVDERTECGARVYGMKGKYLHAAIQRRPEVVDKFGDDRLTEFTRLSRGFFACRKEQIGYAIVAARKPA